MAVADVYHAFLRVLFTKLRLAAFETERANLFAAIVMTEVLHKIDHPRIVALSTQARWFNVFEVESGLTAKFFFTRTNLSAVRTC